MIIGGMNKKIIAAYQANGYLFARIDSAVVKRGEGNIQSRIIWYLDEGPLVRLGKVNLEIDSLAVEELENRLDLNDGDIYRKEYIESEIKLIGTYFADNGYPLAVINISQTDFRTEEDEKRLDLSIQVDPGPQIYLNQIRIRGNKFSTAQVILREIGVQSGDVYSQEKINRIPERLNRLGYFSDIPSVKVINLQKGKTDLLIEVQEGNTSTFDGVVGYIPPEPNQANGQGYFTGLINLNFKNLFGTGRKFEVNWKKPNRFSEEFRLFYEEPWIFSVPLNLGAGLERIVRDTTYIQQMYMLNATVKLSTDFRANLKFSRQEVYPDSFASRTLRLTRNATSNGEIGIDYDTRDYPVNPHSGVNYGAFFKYGLKKNMGPSYVLEEDSLALSENLKTLQLDLAYYQPLWANQVFAFKLHGAYIEGDRNQLQLSDHFWFGGFGTVRGYREEQFHGTTVSWTNLEYRFLIGRNARVFIFNDWGYYQYKETGINRQEVVMGYGIGIRFDSPLGIMGVDYGLGSGDTFSTGKIHFGIINNF
jgi:outer membrane protein insertion porin family